MDSGNPNALLSNNCPIRTSFPSASLHIMNQIGPGFPDPPADLPDLHDYIKPIRLSHLVFVLPGYLVLQTDLGSPDPPTSTRINIPSTSDAHANTDPVISVRPHHLPGPDVTQGLSTPRVAYAPAHVSPRTTDPIIIQSQPGLSAVG